jgi:SAM-dependent methyltransferase
MGLTTIDLLRPLLRCPACRAPLAGDLATCTSAGCPHAAAPFGSVAGQPVLIDETDSIVDPAAVVPASSRAAAGVRALVGAFGPKNLVAPRIADAIVRELAAVVGRRPIVLVVGGGTVGSGLDALYQAPSVEIAAFDVFPSSNTQFVADAHRIPLADGSVDAVVVQAVLEHVLDPWRVAAEIHRVLRADGVVYADTPFLQQVHEGPHDFTRFTESGHRWLFRNFALIESGVVAGPGEQLVWTAGHATKALFSNRVLAAGARLAVRPLAYLIDRFGSPRHAVDGASSVYFFGRRSAHAIAPRDMLGHYGGAQGQARREV